MSRLIFGVSLWDWLDVFSLLAVAFGAVFTLILGYKKSKTSPDKHGLIPVDIYFKKEAIELKKSKRELFWEIVLIAGLIGEIPATINTLSESARLNKEAKEAWEVASSNEVQVAVANSNTAAILERMKSREINQINAEPLMKFSPMNAVIIVGAYGDCSDIGSQIEHSLRGVAHWNVQPILLTAQEVEEGIHIFPWFSNKLSSEDEQKAFDACSMLINALNDENVCSDGGDVDIRRRGTTIKFNGVLIVVGKKPTPNQSERMKIVNALRNIEIHFDQEYQKTNSPGQIEELYRDRTILENRETELDRAISKEDISEIEKLVRTGQGGMFNTKINSAPLP